MWLLVGELGSQDLSSTYAYLLLRRDFADSCILAEDPDSGALLGFIMEYPLPAQPDTAFVWPVAVSEKARRHGLDAERMVSPGIPPAEPVPTSAQEPEHRLRIGSFEAPRLRAAAL